VTSDRTWPCHAWVLLLGDGTAATPVGYGTEASLLILDVATGRELRRIPLPEGHDEPPAELPDGTLVFAVRRKGALQLRRLAPGAEDLEDLLTLPPSAHVRLVPSGDLVFCMRDSTLDLHHLGTGDQLATAALPAPGCCLATSADGGVAVVGDAEGGVHIFHVG
jgi:hypothetical protein